MNEWRQVRENVHFVMSRCYKINSAVRTNNAKEMHKKTFISKEEKNSKVLMSILTNTLFVFSYGLLGFLHHMWSTELQNNSI